MFRYDLFLYIDILNFLCRKIEINNLSCIIRYEINKLKELGCLYL